MVISIQFDANVVTAEIARGDKRGTGAAKWIIAERVRWSMEQSVKHRTAR